MTSEKVKGFRDYDGSEAEDREFLRALIAGTFEKYGFSPAETPVIEYEEFVKGENSSDEAVSDIFKLKDKGERNLALRYEFTFQLKRLMQNKKLPYKRYQIGPVFRDEPVSADRFRQFIQCDIDTIGSTVKDEAEILAAFNELFRKAGIEPVILVNNRKLLNEILDDNKVKEKGREQVLREIDKYDKLPESELRQNLKKLNAENVIDSLKKGEKYFSRFEGYKEIIRLIESCKAYGLSVLFSPSVVRGLSYYNGSVFEIKAKGVKSSIAGGGSYMFNNVQSTGISFSLERLEVVSRLKLKKEKWLIVSLEQDKAAIKLAQKLRSQGKIVSVYYGKPSKALEFANSYNYNKAIFVGAKEVKVKKFKVKLMKTGKESVLKI